MKDLEIVREQEKKLDEIIAGLKKDIANLESMREDIRLKRIQLEIALERIERRA